MGRTQDGFAQAVADVVCRHAPDFDPAALEMRASKEGNWLSFTATVNANVARAARQSVPRAGRASDGEDGPLRLPEPGCHFGGACKGSFLEEQYSQLFSSMNAAMSALTNPLPQAPCRP